MTSKSSVDTSSDHPFTSATGSGMLALWDPESFTHIVDYDSWETDMLDDEPIIEHIRAGRLVPLNILSDGRFGVSVRLCSTGTSELSERERQYARHSSEPYLFRSTGLAKVSGIEEVGSFPDPDPTPPDMAPTEIRIPPGSYAVTIHLLDWEEEPGALDDQRNATDSALPDFVVLIEPTTENTFRTKLETFDDII